MTTFTVASEAEMLALVAEQYDFAVRTDLDKTFRLSIEPATALANWIEWKDPFRLRVMKAISARLKTITPANGYLHDMGDFTDSAGRAAERVFRGRTVFSGANTEGSGDPLPMLSVLEDIRGVPEPLNGTSNSPVAMNEFKIGVMGFVKDDKFNPLDPAYNLSAEVIKALVEGKKERFNVLGMGGHMPCVSGMSIGQPVHRPPDDEVSAVAYFLVPVTLTLAENLESPFT